MFNPISLTATFSRILKPSRLKVEYSGDFVLKFHFMQISLLYLSLASNQVLNVSIMNIRVKDRLGLLKLNRLFDPIRLFYPFSIYTNYRIRNSRNFNTKVLFGINCLNLFKLYDFLIFFLFLLSSRSRASSRSFIVSNKMQINFYNYLGLGFFDSRLDYYGWNEPLLLRLNLRPVNSRKKVALRDLFSDAYNHFLFFMLKIKVQDLRV